MQGVPGHEGTVASWDDETREATIQPANGGAVIEMAAGSIQPYRPTVARRWPSAAAASLIVGEVVRYEVQDGKAVLVTPYP